MQEYPKWVPDKDDPERGRVVLGPDDDPATSQASELPAQAQTAEAPSRQKPRKAVD